ncbi:MAG TPA: dihydrolipoamide acetyltransferase family protein [Caldilineaceae bacterium]|nr:dihydrolipoamide acetyltransferase family protein [Caldilineaceae bacterium]
MATQVKLPDLGEGVVDATISRWRVKEGDSVNEGDVLLEVATDKVDTEVPAPASGKILKIHYGEGELVALDAVLAVIGAEGEEVAEAAPSAGASAVSEQPAEEKPAPEEPELEEEVEVNPAHHAAMQEQGKAEAQDLPRAAEPSAQPQQPSENGHTIKASPVAKRVAADRGIALDSVPGTGPGGRITKEDVLATADGGRAKAGEAVEALPGDVADVPALSVARLAAEHNIDLAEVARGRPLSSLTRYDVMSAVAARAKGEAVAVEPRFAPPRLRPGQAPAQPAAPAQPQPAPRPAAQPTEQRKPAAAPAPAQLAAGEELVKHSRMRQAVARTTTQSIFTAPHVTTMWDVNMAAVLAHRKAHKDEFAAQGVNLTITAYFIQAIIAGLKAVPAANATYTDEGVIIKRYYNIGMAVALPADQTGMGGLIVPVIKNAGDLNLLGTARAVNDLADRARKNQLRPEDLQDGTFTLTNYGTSGSRFQTPIIVQPQVGILGVGAIEKRAVVVSQGHPLEPNTGDYLAFLPMTTLGFSYDHRVLDGATADAFCAAVKDALENWR